MGDPEYKPVRVQFSSGLRQEIATLNASSPEYLSRADNVVFTKRGSVKGRPTAVSRGQDLASTPSGPYPAAVAGTTLAALVSGLAPAGMVSVPARLGSDVALALYQGKAVRRGEDQWDDLGSFYSVRKTRGADLTTNAALKYTNTGTLDPLPFVAVPVGQRLVGVYQNQYNGVGMPVLDSQGQVQGQAGVPVGSSHFGLDTTSQATVRVVNTSFNDDRAFFLDAGGALYCHRPTAFPVYAETTLVAAAGAIVGGGVTMSACAGDAVGVCYVAYLPTGGTKTVKILRVGSAGTVTHSITTAGFAAQPTNVAIAYDVSNNRLVLALSDGTVTMRSKLFSGGSGGFTDLALDATTTTGSFAGTANLVAGSDGAGTTYILGSQADATTLSIDTVVVTRSETVATMSAVLARFPGYSSGTNPGFAQVYPLFQPVVWNGGVFAGVIRGTNPQVPSTFFSPYHAPISTWAVVRLDLLPTQANNRPIAAVGYGASFGLGQAGNALVLPGTGGAVLRFGLIEGRTFDTYGASRLATTTYDLIPTPAKGRTAEGQTFLTGSVPYVQSGAEIREAGFIDGAPAVNVALGAVGGTLTGTASYTFQAVWSYVNGAGKQVRSAAALPVTLSTTGTVKQFTVSVSCPCLRNPASGNVSQPPIVELYMTAPNPAAGANLYLIQTAQISVSPASVSFAVSTEADQTGKLLYTLGNVLDDGPPPGGDRGVVEVAGRVWVADQFAVYPSKLFDGLTSPGWNTGTSALTVRCPGALGEINALEVLDDKVVAVCSRGVFVVVGAGIDNLGNGPGFGTQILSAPGGAATVRSSASMPEGVAYVGNDNNVYLVTRGLTVQPISRPARLALSGMAPDLNYVRAASGTNALLLVGGGTGGDTQFVTLDTETGQWGRWLFTIFAVISTADVNGTAWTQVDDGNAVVSFTGPAGLEYGVNSPGNYVPATVQTGMVPEADGSLGWGRIRSLSVLGPAPSSGYNLTCAVFGDADARTLCNKTVAVGTGTNVNWPSASPEFRMTVQRAGFAVVQLTADRGFAEWAELNLWVASETGRQPSRNRS